VYFLSGNLVIERRGSMIRVQINQQEEEELQRFRGQSSSRHSEKALMVLMNANGESPVIVAGKLSRNPHTVRFWLKRYLAGGLEGLKRKYSPGRPSDKRMECIEVTKEILAQSPQQFKYPDSVWSIPLIQYHLKTEHQLEVSEDTLVRSLKDLGYSYKRPSKTVSPKAPSPAEKKVAVKAMIEAIGKLIEEKPCEIFALDESHFSTEPYLVKGWFKKRWPPQDSWCHKKGKLYYVWMLKFKEAAFLLEAIQAS
jgi:transposase